MSDRNGNLYAVDIACSHIVFIFSSLITSTQNIISKVCVGAISQYLLN